MSEIKHKYRDETWDFQSANTKEYTHCFHIYPAIMIPQIARKLLNRYGVKGGWLLDPYCGTGTSLVEASLFGMHSVGCDINPLVRLVAAAKLTPIPLKMLDQHLTKLNHCLFQTEFSNTMPADTHVPNIKNLEYWFSTYTIKYLAFLRRWIRDVENEAVRNFMWIAFSETVREVSYTRNGEFKLYRMPTHKLAHFEPDVFGIFRKKLSRNRHGLAAFLQKRKNVEATISNANTAHGEIPMPKPPGGYNVVITSPPYGDSQTTVAYGQFSRLSAEWIGCPNARKIHRIAMGGHQTDQKLGDSPVADAIEKIRSIDEKRARQVSAFYIDLRKSICTVAKMLATNSTVCYVVGNRKVKGVTLPTDAFIRYAFNTHRFAHTETIVRNIPSACPREIAPPTSHDKQIQRCTRNILSFVREQDAVQHNLGNLN